MTIQEKIRAKMEELRPNVSPETIAIAEQMKTFDIRDSDNCLMGNVCDCQD